MPNYISKFTGSEIDRRLTDVDSKISANEKGAKNGVASLDESGKVPSTQLPSYVDDVLEFNSRDNFPQTGESGKLYLALDSNKIYRWSGSRYIEIVGGESADKFIDIEVDCDHKYEITGMTGHTFNLAIPNKAQVVFKKIQGQSRRRSLNLIEVPKSSVSSNGITATFQNGIVFLNGTATAQTNINISKQYNVNDIPLNNKTLLAYSSAKTSTDVEVHFYGTDFISHKIFNLRYATEPSYLNENISFYNVGLTIPQGSSFNNLKIFIEIVNGSFDASTMPPFEPFDSYLENSKNHFISTGRNLFASESFSDANLKYDASTCEITMQKTEFAVHDIKQINLPKGTYTFLRSSTGAINTALIDSNGADFTMPYHNNKLVIKLTADTMFNQISTNGAVKSTFKIAIVAGDVAYDAKYFEPYNQTMTKFGMELGEYDYIQNGKIVRQTSERKLLDGTENWTIEGGSPNKRFRFLDKSLVGFKSNTEINLATNSLLDSTTANHTWGDSSGRNMISFDSDTFHIVINGLTTVQQLKDWLKAHPITLVYKLAEPTTSKVDLPNGYGVSFGGLEEQSGKLPYIITKNYPISLSSQLKNNVFIDNAQQSEIDNNARRIFTTNYAKDSDIRDLFTSRKEK